MMMSTAPISRRRRPPPPVSDGRDGHDAPRVVTLSQRAVPLLELLRAAKAKKADVMWDN